MIYAMSNLQCCQPSVKITETSVFSVVERDRSVIRNLGVKYQKPPYFHMMEKNIRILKKF